MISKMRKILMFSVLAMVALALGTVVPLVSAQGGTPPPPVLPAYIPPEISAYPSTQTVYAPNYTAYWTVSIAGQGSNLCVNACWGDPCLCGKSCGWHSGDNLGYSHNFACGGSSPYRQTWTLSGVIGGPVSTGSTVYK
jgi:hypothetical protein